MGQPLSNGAFGTPAFGDQANAVVSGAFTGVGPSAPFAFWGPFNLLIWNEVSTSLTTNAGSLNATVGSASGLAAGNPINSAVAPPGATIGSITGTDIVLALAPISLYGVVNTVNASVSGLPSTTGLLDAAVSGPGIPKGTTVTAIAIAAVAPTDQSPGSTGTVLLSKQPTIATAPTNYPLGGPQGTPLTFVPTGNAITGGEDPAAIFTGSAFAATVQLERSFDGGNTWITCNIGGAALLAQYIDSTPISCVVGETEKGVAYRLNCIDYTSGTIAYRLSTTGAASLSLAVASNI